MKQIPEKGGRASASGANPHRLVLNYASICCYPSPSYPPTTWPGSLLMWHLEAPESIHTRLPHPSREISRTAPTTGTSIPQRLLV
ncbi:hypothetical protein MKX08_000316 [Trichoderma sp. CBMAI-0020]|nr:hypothetical protein MKX08_000316 [Trichoderma sp. CBMAI-0020]